MALKYLKISALPDGTLASSSAFVVDTPDQQEASGYKTYGIEASEIKDKLLNSFQYTQDLDTTDKKIVGAVAELGLADGLGYIGRSHIQAGNAFAWVKDIFREPNVEIEIYSNNTTGIRQIVINDNMLIVYFADSSFDYDVEVIARHGLV